MFDNNVRHGEDPALRRVVPRATRLIVWLPINWKLILIPVVRATADSHRTIVAATAVIAFKIVTILS